MVVNTAYSQNTRSLYRKAILDSAKTFESAGDFHRALLMYEKVLKENPKDLETRSYIARDLGWEGRYDSSLAVYNEVLAADPLYYDALVGHATVLSWKGRYRESLRELSRLIQRYPENPQLLVLFARISLWAGHIDDAISYAKKLIHISPADTDALLILAQAYGRKLDFRSARETVRKLLRINPENQKARRLAATLREEFRNTISVGLDAQDFGPDSRFTNKVSALTLTRRVSYNLSLFVEMESRYIFGSQDIAANVGGALRCSERVSLNGEFLFGPGTNTAQRERATVGISYSPLTSLAAAATFQYLSFQTTRVGIFSPSLEYYLSPNYSVMIRGYFGETTDHSSSAAALARLMLNPSENLRLVLNAYHGIEYNQLLSSSYLSVTATGGSAGARYSVSRNIAADISIGYTRWQSSPWKYSYRGDLGLSYQW